MGPWIGGVGLAEVEVPLGFSAGRADLGPHRRD
jgi:hypothetical protein